MNAFKVTFDENKPVSASQVYDTHFDSAQIEEAEGLRAIKWLTIYADDERESIKIAGKVAKEYLDMAA